MAAGVGPGLLEPRQFLQLGVGHEAAPEGDGANQAGEGGGNHELRPGGEVRRGRGRNRLLVAPRQHRLRLRVPELGPGHQRGGRTAKPVEERHHLRHARHRIPQRHHRADAAADQSREPEHHQRPRAVPGHAAHHVLLEAGGDQGDRHAGGSKVVAFHGRPRAGHQLEGQDEEHRGCEIREIDPGLARHAATSSWVGTWRACGA